MAWHDRVGGQSLISTFRENLNDMERYISTVPKISTRIAKYGAIKEKLPKVTIKISRVI
jgi:hypothetical protein